jgi:hypothetical protein
MDPTEMSLTSTTNDHLARRIAVNKDRIDRLSKIATHPTAKLDIQRALDDLNDAASWAMRKDLDAWTELARSVSATIDFAEWRLRTLERILLAKGPHGAQED